MSRLQQRHDDLRRRQALRLMLSNGARRLGDDREADRHMAVVVKLKRKRMAVVDRAVRRGHDMADWP